MTPHDEDLRSNRKEVHVVGSPPLDQPGENYCPPHRYASQAWLQLAALTRHLETRPLWLPEPTNHGHKTPKRKRHWICGFFSLLAELTVGLGHCRGPGETPRQRYPDRATDCHHQGPLCLVIWVTFMVAPRHSGKATNLRMEEQKKFSTLWLLQGHNLGPTVSSVPSFSRRSRVSILKFENKRNVRDRGKRHPVPPVVRCRECLGR